jgi:hypothetical protein
MHDWKGNPAIAGGDNPVAFSAEDAEAAKAATNFNHHKDVFKKVMDQVFKDDPQPKILSMVGKKGIQELSRKVLLSNAGSDKAEEDRITKMTDPYTSLMLRLRHEATGSDADKDLLDLLKTEFVKTITTTGDKKVMYHFLQKIGVQNIPSEVLPEAGKTLDPKTHFLERINDTNFQERSLGPELDPERVDSEFNQWKNKTENMFNAASTPQKYIELLANDKVAAGQFLKNIITKHTYNPRLLARLIGPDYYDHLTAHANSAAAKKAFGTYTQSLKNNITDEMVDAFQAYVKAKQTRPIEAEPTAASVAFPEI